MLDDIPASPIGKEETATVETNSLLAAKGSDEAKVKMEDEALELVVKVPISDFAAKHAWFIDLKKSANYSGELFDWIELFGFQK